MPSQATLGGDTKPPESKRWKRKLAEREESIALCKILFYTSFY